MKKIHSHSHSHGIVAPSILTHERGLWAVKWSFIVLMVTAFIQLFIVFISNSVSLLADTLHNFGDASTAIPLSIAFFLAKLKPSKRFTYGYGRVEDLAGIFIVLTIFASGVFAAYQSIQRFLYPAPMEHVGIVALASILSFLSNEGVAIFRIKVGKEIGSAALIADGKHARIDGWGSLAVLGGAAGTWFGFPILDPVMGIIITLSIFYIVWESGKEVFSRALDGIDPHLLEDVNHIVRHVCSVKDVWGVKARWIGHKINLEINVAVSEDISLSEAHKIAEEVRHELLHYLPHLGNAIIHVDPENKPGEPYHSTTCHIQDGRPPHCH